MHALPDFSKTRLLVAGDVMLDRYWSGATQRISPEAPVPVVKINRDKSMPGGAANTAVNIRMLGGQVDLAGVVGDDHAGRELLASLRAQGIGTTGIVSTPGFPTIVKMRVIADRQQVVRVDWERPAGMSRVARRRLTTQSVRLAAAASGVLLSDYGKGVLDQDLIDAILGAARRKDVPVGLDPKDTHVLNVRGIALATPNCREAHICAGLPARATIPGDPLRDENLRRAAEILLHAWQVEQLIITLGAQGMYLAAPDHPPEVIPTRAREVFDVSGAGDTVIAACLLAIAAGAARHEAAMLGNYAAGVVVGKLGTAWCSPGELLAAIREDHRA